MSSQAPITIHPRRPRHQLKGRQASDAARAEVRARLGAAPAEGYRRDLLIEYLHALNDHYHGLYERHLVALAAELRLSMAEVYEVATFYHHFEVLPDDATAPRATVRVCTSLSCQMAGAQALLEGLGASPLGEGVRVVAAPCVGRCDEAPAALVSAGGQMRSLGGATAERVREALSPAPQTARVEAGPRVAPEAIGFARYRDGGGYRLAEQLAAGALAPDAVIEALEHAGLRGLGGAGFPAGRKWRIVRGFVQQLAEREAAAGGDGGSGAAGAPGLMAVNIDEGEPGTFKDRYFLERDPHRFLEGVLIAAQVVGCGAAYLYLRDEYPECRALLAQAIADMQSAPQLGALLPRLELRRGAGAYICGEESAMIESIEGKRGEPRLRPPYIAEVGLFGRPTLEHNFETLYAVREILERGGAWFAAQGRHGRQGLRSFSVSGRVKQPGVKRAPAGITLRELIDEHCGGMAEGHTLYAYLPGGASGGIFPARLADVPLDFDTLQPHGGFIGSAAVIVLSEHDRARDAALSMMQFFADESCGQCTPCRVGTAKAARLMQAAVWDAATLAELSAVMLDASICGLGQAAPNPLQCVQKYFAHEVEARGS